MRFAADGDMIRCSVGGRTPSVQGAASGHQIGTREVCRPQFVYAVFEALSRRPTVKR